MKAQADDKTRTTPPVFECIGNIFQLRLEQLVTPEVPVNEGKMDSIRDKFYKTGANQLPFYFTIAVTSLPEKEEDFLQGPQSRICPDEPFFAMLRQASQDLERHKASKEKYAECKEVWGRLFRCVRLKILYVRRGDAASLPLALLRESMNLRQEALQISDVMQRTTIEFIFEVAGVGRKVEAGGVVGEEAIVESTEAFYKSVAMARKDDKVTKDVIKDVSFFLFRTGRSARRGGVRRSSTVGNWRNQLYSTGGGGGRAGSTSTVRSAVIFKPSCPRTVFSRAFLALEFSFQSFLTSNFLPSVSSHCLDI